MPIFGIDVSKWQTTIDWSRVARSGIKFAIARASIGTVTDAYYAANARGMRANGIIPGAYHFLEPARVVSPEAQADKFMSLIGNPEGMLVVLDVEKDGANYPAITDVERWVARFRAKYPKHPLLIYTGKWYWAGSSYPIKNANGSRFGKLWHSHYVSATGSSPATLYQSVTSGMWDPDYGGWPEATFLQFSSSSVVGGVTGRCDANAFRGSLDELRAFTTSNQTSPEETVRSFSVPAKPSVAVIRDGAWLYDNDGLSPSESNINIDGAREMPLHGTLPGTVRIVEYVRSDGTRSGKAYFVKPEHVSTVREVPAPEPVPVDCTPAIEAAVAEVTETLNAHIADLSNRLVTEVEAARAEEQAKLELAVAAARAEEQAACADVRSDLTAIVDAHRTIGRVVAENPE